ncbi:LysR family transcriptional regulator [Vibrio metschnikovii]|uniref:LysR family transcriptional regulator n=1 Tax=Vibrio TaxID=662 RepID=UPI001483146C|nr:MULTISPECIES: LysR family transcriptional regulator [Vibrio]MBC3615932.1 LysR family transcriptional regulator [Vibrio metschnikovii]MBC3620076.1 LysR family transcriptional regulator [Vibrio metschnikovii]MBC5811862.1 LysR family transcriptional regulator [Vibrio metschnikovii]MBC5830407.1 LysR family transcriptional regulator [Vibrio metschnikovii]NNN85437.1 LysR family transcriptional regulator [Vibrio sp. A8-1]
MFQNINLNLLKSLHIILHETHVSNAAKRLYITQSAMSRQLAQLREICQDELLVRNSNFYVLTPKAELLKKKLDLFFSDFEHLLNDVKFEPKNWQGEFVISSSDYVAQYILPHICSTLGQLAPKLDISYQLWNPLHIGKLHELGIDIASTMLSEKPEGISSQFIGSDYSVLAMRAGHPLSNKDKISINDLISYPYIKITGGADKDYLFDQYIDALKLTRNIKLKVPFFSGATTQLIQTDSLMVIPLHIAKTLEKLSSITYKQLPFDIGINKYWLIWHPKFDNAPSHKWIREQIMLIMQENEYSIHIS